VLTPHYIAYEKPKNRRKRATVWGLGKTERAAQRDADQNIKDWTGSAKAKGKIQLIVCPCTKDLITWVNTHGGEVVPLTFRNGIANIEKRK
jgi:hypothetical protein